MYYKLTYVSSTDRSKIGDYVLNALKPLDIGQGQSCALQLPDDSGFEPSVVATIQPLSNGGWCIVRRSEGGEIKVNGDNIAIARKLYNKDEISFATGEDKTILRYEEFDNGDYDAASGLVYDHQRGGRKVLWTSIILAFVAIAIACYALFGSKSDELRHSIPQDYSKALYHITVDSVSLLHITNVDGKEHYEIVESAELQPACVGTCFLTDDSLLVTARHCLEPWLDDNTWNGETLDEKLSPDVRMAIKAETANRLSGKEEYIVRSHCIISLGEYSKSYYSTDFYMDKSRDMVITLGTEERPLYWRTIFPIAHRRTMELGDFAYIKAPKDLKNFYGLPVATLDELKLFDNNADHDIAVMGYPINDNNAEQNVKTNFGNAQPLELNAKGQFLGCIQMTAPIARGNSGGPVLAIVNGKVKVIGIVSKADMKAEQQTFWAVPITEVERMHEDGDKVKTDDRIFRR